MVDRSTSIRRPHPHDHLPDVADVIVIGAGIVGLCCAYFLERAGRRPIVLDQGEVGRGSSHGNAGLVAPSHSVPLPAPGVVAQALRWLARPASPFFIRARLDPALARWLARFAWSARRGPMLRAIPTLRDLNLLSLDLYGELARESDGVLKYCPSGVLNVYKTERAFEHGRDEAALLAGFGVTSQVLAAREVAAAEPCLRDGLAGAVLWPQDGYVDPAAFVAGLQTILARREVPILPHTEAFAIESDGRDQVVRSSSGQLRCRSIVIAAGPWSVKLVRNLGHRLHVQAAKGYSLTIPGSTARPLRPLLLTEAKVALTPLASGLRIAGTLELAGLDRTIDFRRLDAVRRSADTYLGAPATGTGETVWRGLRALSADGLPFIGRLPACPEVAVATGHGHIGVSLAPATGKLIADLMTGRPPAIDVTPLRPVR
jgi:D-amino-acid dehydrogenase